MTKKVHAGAKKAIKPRKMSFPFKEINNKYWYDDNSILTTFFAALSASFPPGEQQFIDSVRFYRDQVRDKTLLEQIRGFIGQEGHHSAQHRKANEILEQLGLPVSRLEANLKSDIEKLNKIMSPASQLASTAAMEHITAIMAEHVLTHPELTDKMEPSVAELIKWHAIEEIEHKAVAFDVYERCVGNRTLLKRTMAIVSTEFVIRMLCYQIALLYWDRKIPSPKEFWGAAKFFFGKEGMVSKLRRPYMAFYGDNFHPWDHDNSHLIESWKRLHGELEPQAQVQAA